MTVLAEICAAIDCIAAAWVDTRIGVVVEQRTSREHALIGPALDAMTELMRSRERPPRMVLLSAQHVHIAHRQARDPHRVLVVLCDRSANLGFAVATVRSIFEAAEQAA